MDNEFNPLPVSGIAGASNSTNIIMWMDHRAQSQADFINSTNHVCLKTVGDSISLEMDPPKILWLKENAFEECFSKAGNFFSLPDFLVWKSSNVNIRSVCTTTCKWLFNASESKWEASFWNSIGLNELVTNNFAKIGTNVQNTFKYIEDLKISQVMMDVTGLSANVKIGVSMIDAHAGGIGGISITKCYFERLKATGNNTAYLEKYFTNQLQMQADEILVLVSGTSSCLMASSRTPNYIPGIWGPYFNGMVPGMYLNEAGQSVSGKLIEHIIQNHSAYEELKEKYNSNMFDHLNKILIQLADKENLNEFNLSRLTKNIHIYPDFHGNRSPLADSTMKGSIVGLNLDTSLNSLALLYLACIQSLAYQTRQIISIMNLNNMNFKVITVIGGLSNNRLYCQTLSDVCNIPVLVARNGESIVLLGSSMLGASNCVNYVDFENFIQRFSEFQLDADVLLPNQCTQGFHEKKYQVFLRLLADQQDYSNLMKE